MVAQPLGPGDPKTLSDKGSHSEHMTIRKLMILTALIAASFAMLRPLFGIGVFVLAFVPLSTFLLFRRITWNRWIQCVVITACLILPDGTRFAVARLCLPFAD